MWVKCERCVRCTEMTWHPIPGSFPLHTPCSWDRLRNHSHPDQDTVLTGDEWWAFEYSLAEYLRTFECKVYWVFEFGTSWVFEFVSIWVWTVRLLIIWVFAISVECLSIWSFVLISSSSLIISVILISWTLKIHEWKFLIFLCYFFHVDTGLGKEHHRCNYVTNNHIPWALYILNKSPSSSSGVTNTLPLICILSSDTRLRSHICHDHASVLLSCFF